MRTVTMEDAAYASQGNTSSEIKSYFQTEVINAIKGLSANYFDHLKNKNLDDGIYAPEEYCALIQNYPNRLAFLAEQNASIYGRAPSKFFENEIRNNVRLVNVFKIKSGVLPSQAIDAMVKGLSLLDCGAVVSLAYHIALRNFFKSDQGSDDRFNEIFKESGNNPLKIAMGKHGFGSLTPLIRAQDVNDLNDGDTIHVNGLKECSEKHLIGRFGGHTMVVYKNRFYGQGSPVEGIDEKGLEQLMIDECNKTPEMIKTTRMVSRVFQERGYSASQLKKQEELKNHQVSHDDYRKQGGAQIRSAATWNYEIAILAKVIPLNELQEFFKSIEFQYA